MTSHKSMQQGLLNSICKQHQFNVCDKWGFDEFGGNMEGNGHHEENRY